MQRQPYRAGSFYEADPAECRRSAAAILDAVALPEDLPADLFGGLVPHAGWMFSARTAGFTLKALAGRGRLSRVVLFGSDHWGVGGVAAMYDRGAWLTPLGSVPVDEELAAALLAECPLLRADARAHAREHSLEVQLPLLQVLCPDVRIVPITVPPTGQSAEVGAGVGAALRRLAAASPAWARVSCLGSTDLTHYGPQYGFSPGGFGRGGLEWSKDNDRRLLKLVEAMRAEKIVPEAQLRHNACGAGAVAATIAACAALGATRGLCLDYTTSADVLRDLHQRRSDDAVGYAAAVFA